MQHPTAHNPKVVESVQAILRDGTWCNYHGGAIDQLKENLSARFDRPHVQLCSSGTIATELALRGLKVGPGDEVILCGYDFPGNFRAIEAVGAVPVLIDLCS